jgi:UDP-N-acetylglucosamine transferase subunit ALG13
MAVFVTVGTTSFDALIATVDSAPFAALLQEKGYSRLVVQYGEHEAGLYSGAAVSARNR